MTRPGFSFSTSFRVRYSEIDGQRVVFNSRYLEYVDVAAFAYWEWTGATEVLGDGWRDTEFHVRHAEVDYLKPFVWGDEVEVSVRIERLGQSSLVLRYEMAEAKSGDLHATAIVSTVNIDLDTHRSKPIAGPLRQFIEALIVAQPDRIA